MIVMFIFLFLSIVFVVGTAFYLNYKKNNSNIKQIMPNKYIKERLKKSNKKQLADILNININDNIINVGNRYSSIIKFGNVDYNMLSNHEQEAIENILIQTALSIDYPIQFFSTTEFIDTSKVISIIEDNKSNNVNIKEYQDFLIDYLQNLMENKTISIVKNYAVISYDGSYEKAIEELNRHTLSFKGNLLRAKIVCETLSEDELYNLIYRELNKNSTLNVSALKKGGDLYVGKKQQRKEKRNRYI